MRDFLLLHFFGLSSFGEYWTENITERTRIEFVRNNFLNCKVNVLRNQYAFCEPNVERSPIRVTHFQLPSITRKSIQYVASVCWIIRRTHVVDGTAFVLLLQLLRGDNYKSTGVKRILRRTRNNGICFGYLHLRGLQCPIRNVIFSSASFVLAAFHLI